jgi:26S proteasome regulatory subunit N10
MTRNIGTVMNSITKDVRVGGIAKFVDGLKIAQLALKNRQNKNQKQRIIIFVASPLNMEIPELERLGKNFKKNAVAIDVINFGTENATNGNAAKLEALVNCANSGDNSHFVNIPPGPQILSDVILTSSIMTDAQVGGGDNADPELSAAMAASLASSGAPAAAAASTTVGGINYADFGIDPNLEPDLAMALRMSMEDEKQRQERAAATTASSATTTTPATSTTAAPSTPAPSATPSTPSTVAAASGVAAMEDADEEGPDDDELAAAIAMSMTENLEPPAGTTAPTVTEAVTAAVTAVVNNTAVEEQKQIKNALKDKEFLADLLDSAGVDSDDVAIDDILMGLGGDDEEEAQKKTDKKPEEGK